MMWDGLYTFDAADAALTLLPMAARRALDVAGKHLSLHDWQTLDLAARRALVALGAAPVVDALAVDRCVVDSGIAMREQAVRPDPPDDAPPLDVRHALGPARELDALAWSRLRALDRYVLAQLAGRGKLERLATAHDEIVEAHGGRAMLSPLPPK
jgi:hypothetical protein